MPNIDHETLPEEGHHYQDYTFTLDGPTISVTPAIPRALARALVGEEWQFVKAPRQGTDETALLRDVSGFKHHDYYRGVEPCQEVVDVFQATAYDVLRQSGNYVRFIRENSSAL